MMKYLAIAFDEGQEVAAEKLAKELGLVIDNQAENRLLIASEKVELTIKPFLPMSINFEAKFWQKRRDEGKKQALVRACNPRAGLSIIDATAGWGRDAAILASFGAKVTMLERNPIMQVLLENALLRASGSHKPLLLSLHKENAIHFFQQLRPENYPDIVYIDPMHPPRQKTALVKKDLQVLQNLIGCDEDADQLINLARARVRQKVVVKWPQQLRALLPCQQSISGKTVRFDIYLPKPIED